MPFVLFTRNIYNSIFGPAIIAVRVATTRKVAKSVSIFHSHLIEVIIFCFAVDILFAFECERCCRRLDYSFSGIHLAFTIPYSTKETIISFISHIASICFKQSGQMHWVCWSKWDASFERRTLRWISFILVVSWEWECVCVILWYFFGAVLNAFFRRISFSHISSLYLYWMCRRKSIWIIVRGADFIFELCHHLFISR